MFLITPRYMCGAFSASPASITVLDIFLKIWKESFFWGFGTAIGELPPYFFSRAG
jgi:hypothetical protein